jgi:hypothetical protein
MTTEDTENTERENDLQCELAAWELLREATHKYDNLATEHMLTMNKLAEERDEAREDVIKLQDIKRKHEHEELAAAQENDRLKQERDEAIAARKASAADWLLQVENADRRVSEAKKMAARAVQDAAALADKLSGLELRSTEELARLEQERNEERAVADELASVAARCLGWHDHECPDAAIKIAAALKRWKKMRREL